MSRGISRDAARRTGCAERSPHRAERPGFIQQRLGGALPVDDDRDPDVLLAIEPKPVRHPATLAQLHGHVRRVRGFRNGKAGPDPTFCRFDKYAPTVRHRTRPLPMFEDPSAGGIAGRPRNGHQSPRKASAKFKRGSRSRPAARRDSGQAIGSAKQSWKRWCPGAESNHRHRDFQSRALPTELPGRRSPAGAAGRKSAGVIKASPRSVHPAGRAGR